jgi:hypothetical protein
VIHDLEQWRASGSDCTEEVHSLTFQGENQRSSLYWLCLTMSLLKELFFRVITFFRVKILDLRSGDDGARTLYLSWRRRFWRSWTSGADLMVLVLLLQGMNHSSGIFLFFCNSSSFFWLCICIALGLCVVEEARCNWYHLNINIYSL